MVRHKNRYIAVEINQQGTKKEEASLILNAGAVHASLTQKIQQLHGDFGVAAVRTGYTAKYCNEKTRVAIIRVRHGPHKLVASVLPCINKMDGKHVVINTLYTGATIRQCFKFLQNYQQEKVDQFCASLKTAEEKKSMSVALLNIENVMEM